MADIFTKQKRSEVMSHIRSSGTKSELRLRQLVKSVVGRRKLIFNVNSLPGCPDVVIPSLHVAIFADGCFYHCCPKHGHCPESNVSYWKPKLERNRLRDVANARQLRKSGFCVWRIWEHDLGSRAIPSTKARIAARLRKRVATLG